MTIYAELKKDHETVLGLLDELVQAEKSDLSTRRGIIAKITAALVPHSRAEEAVFYNAIRAVSKDDLIAHSYVEHLEAETLLRSLQLAEAVDVHWKNGAKKLKEALSHHIEEEQGPLFAKAKELFAEDEAEMLGVAFVQLKAKLQGTGLMKSSLELIVNLLPERFRPKAAELLAKQIFDSGNVDKKAS